MPKILKCVEKGIAAGAAALFICCLAIGIIQLFADISDAILSAVSVLALAISSYTSSYVSTQLYRSKGLLQGILCGLTVFGITLAVSAVTKNFSFSDLTIVKALFCMISGAVGGIKGVNTKKTNLPRRLH